MRAMTSGVFSQPCSSAARAPHPVDLDIALDELPAAGGDRGRVDAEEGGDAPVATPPALERFESGEQPALALVEEAGEQHDGGAQLLGHQVGVGQGPPESGRGHQQPSGAELMGLLRVVGRAVEGGPPGSQRGPGGAFPGRAPLMGEAGPETRRGHRPARPLPRGARPRSWKLGEVGRRVLHHRAPVRRARRPGGGAAPEVRPGACSRQARSRRGVGAPAGRRSQRGPRRDGSGRGKPSSPPQTSDPRVAGFGDPDLEAVDAGIGAWRAGGIDPYLAFFSIRLYGCAPESLLHPTQDRLDHVFS